MSMPIDLIPLNRGYKSGRRFDLLATLAAVLFSCFVAFCSRTSFAASFFAFSLASIIVRFIYDNTFYFADLF